MKFNPIQNIIHFVHYKLTSNLFKQTEIYYTSEFSSRIAVGSMLNVSIIILYSWLRNNLGIDFSIFESKLYNIDNETTFIIKFFFTSILYTLLLFRPVRFKTFWKIHKSITKNEEHYKQLKRKFIFQFVGIVIIFFIIRALLKFYYPN
jgi:hypothetical protein